MERSMHLLLLVAHLTGVATGQTSETIVGTLGDSVSLPCHGIPSNGTRSVVRWLKDGKIAASRNLSSMAGPTGNVHFSVSDQGSLTISGLLLSDQGIYSCNDSVPNHTAEKQTDIQLLIANGPSNMWTDIKPTVLLPNGALFVQKGSDVSFNCSSESYPSQALSWVFQGDTSNSSLLSSSDRSPLEISLLNIQPNHQGTYSCISQNMLSNRTASKSTSLLVYYAPDRHPECFSHAINDSLHLLLHCSWSGSNPLPMLHWEEEPGAHGTRPPVLNVSMTTESLEVTLNRSQLYNGQTMRCKAYNNMVKSEAKFCSITLQSPFPQGNPLVTAVEGSDITLTCTENSSLPPAKTTWRRKISQEEVVPGAKYVISELGPTFSLKIINLTKEDEGPYFCRSENPVLVQELEVFLTVKSSQTYAGGVVGAFIAALIIGIGIAVGTSAYRNRDRICLGSGFG
ncbi:hypothetical protein COCON_G00158720 [Conger conger]|uniref:Ig-like domain-containing protein n=1 Tax=Conger conger TaxID=82655 RepID=A0A9Q1D9V9_CONCO|nr:V-set and immunoglobulin domain-containing protein 10 isoform X2 [Conger conger]KAJ8263415.1 hypothetical protein COCON_G00158720 [Conger conger]